MTISFTLKNIFWPTWEASKGYIIMAQEDEVVYLCLLEMEGEFNPGIMTPLIPLKPLIPVLIWASQVAQWLKNPPAMQETQVRSLAWEDPLEEGMATHCSIFARRIPRTEEPGGL